MKRIKFTQEQEDFIRNNYMNMSNKKISEYFNNSNITIGKVQYWLKQNGLYREKSYKNNPIFSNEDIEFIKNNYNKMTYSEMTKYLPNFTDKQLRNKARILGLSKTRKINDHYFDIIDTELKAYYLGFIFADGWICYNSNNRNYEFGMELQSDDKYILEILNKELGGLNVIKHTDPHDDFINGNKIHANHTDCLRVYSKNIVLGLMNNGIETNKTLKDVYPIVDDSLFFDWLRGYIDGDGCFWKYKNNYYMHITCASEIVLKYIQNKLFSFGIETRLYKENDRKYRLMCVNIEEMKKLVARLYYKDELLYLTRKYEKVKYYLGFAA